MPYKVVKENDKYCVHKENADGSVGETVKCHPTESEAMGHMRALYANVEDAAAKYFQMIGVKAVGDWEIEIRAVPYGFDSDGQYFDDKTDFMEETFNNPAIFYHHGVKPGKKELEDKPVIIGKALSVERRSDGMYIRALLDKASEYAGRVWEAVKQGIAVASSDSIAHLARLDIGGKRIMYEKSRPGHIAVWPLAGISLWDAVAENFRPASPRAVALPAMKAMYREAGIPFPDIDTGGDAEAEEVKHRTRVEEAQKEGLKLLESLEG